MRVDWKQQVVDTYKEIFDFWLSSDRDSQSLNCVFDSLKKN